MAPPGGEGAQSRVDSQTGLPLGAPEAGSLWRSANAETAEKAEPQHSAGAAPGGVPAPAQPAARKTVSAKSTPNDDASEASTNEAAISEIATPSPNEEFQPAAAASALPKGGGVPSLRSPVMHPLAAKSPAEDLAVHAHHASRAESNAGAAVGSSGGALPPLVHSNSSVTSPSTPAMAPPAMPPAQAAAGAGDDAGNETDSVAVRLHQNLGLKSTPAGPAAAPGAGAAGTVPAPQAPRAAEGGAAAAAVHGSSGGEAQSSGQAEFVRFMIAFLSRQLPTDGRAELSAAIKLHGGHALAKGLPVAPQSQASMNELSMNEQRMNELVHKMQRLAQKFSLTVPPFEPAGSAPAAAAAAAPASAAPEALAEQAAASTVGARGAVGGAGAAPSRAAAAHGGGPAERRATTTGKRDDPDRLGEAHAASSSNDGAKRRRSAASAAPQGGSAGAAVRPASAGAARPPAAAPRAAAGGAGAGGAMEDGQSMVAKLAETPLCTHLTKALAGVTQGGGGGEAGAASVAPMVVRVVGETKTSSGGYLHTSKAIMAFQEEERGKEVVVLALYVMEFGADSPPPNTGRVYVECLDGVPLRRGEKGYVCVCV